MDKENTNETKEGQFVENMENTTETVAPAAKPSLLATVKANFNVFWTGLIVGALMCLGILYFSFKDLKYMPTTMSARVSLWEWGDKVGHIYNKSDVTIRMTITVEDTNGEEIAEWEQEVPANDNIEVSYNTENPVNLKAGHKVYLSASGYLPVSYEVK